MNQGKVEHSYLRVQSHDSTELCRNGESLRVQTPSLSPETYLMIWRKASLN